MRRNDAPTPEQEQDAAKIAAAAEAKRQAPYLWLSEVERICIKAFVPDADILSRSRAKLSARNANRVKIDAGAVEFWSTALERPLAPELEAQAQAKAQAGMDNRDLLAARIDRPTATVRWKGCPTDAYGQGADAYRARLAAIGMALAVLGWLTEPEGHPWKHVERKRGSMDDPRRMADADANAKAMVGGEDRGVSL
jgi:hypothetical protein